MVAGLGSATSGLGGSILVVESDSGNHLVNFVVNHKFDSPPTAIQFTAKFTK